jgi:hypothetical protein
LKGVGWKILRVHNVPEHIFRSALIPLFDCLES